MARNPNKGKKGEAEEKRLEAFRLYKDGWTYRDIAAQIGMSYQRVGEYIKECLDELKKQREALGNQIIDAELERMDEMLKELRPLTKTRMVARPVKDINGSVIDEVEEEVGPSMDAIDRVLKIQERRAKYLGLDAPKKLEHDVSETLESLIAGSRAPNEEKK